MFRIEQLQQESFWQELRSKFKLSDLTTIPSTISPYSSSDFLGTYQFLKKRACAAYPAYLALDEGLWCSDEEIFSACNIVALRDSHSTFMSNGTETPFSYTSYLHYLTAKKFWGVGHNSVFNTSSQDVECFIPITRIFQAKSNFINGNSYLLSHHADHDNYWHWTFDCFLPLLLLRERHPLVWKSLDNILIITKDETGPTSFQREMLSRASLFYDFPPILITTNDVIMENYIKYQPESPLVHSKLAIATAKKSLLDLMGIKRSDDSRRCQKLYIRRGFARNGRNLINESELIHKLDHLGFVIISPGNMTVKEQYTMFCNSCLVLGVHGSAFVNMIAMKENSQVIELVGNTYSPIHDYILANDLSLKYCEIEIYPESDAWSSDYSCNVYEVSSRLSDF